MHEQGQQRDDTQRLVHDTPPCVMNKCMCVCCMKLIVLIGSPYASASSLGEQTVGLSTKFVNRKAKLSLLN